MAHTPVLLNEVVEALDPRSGDLMIDGTVDGGGHAAAIIKKIMPNGTFLGVDMDTVMIARYKNSTNERYVHGNYADLPEILRKEKLGKADGLLLDLGFSSEQLQASGRGFSFSEAAREEPLLMTYDGTTTPVAEILRRVSEKELADILFTLGGERRSRAIARAIKEHGKAHRILTAGALADVVRGAVPQGYEHGRIDAATRTFQALRIYANGELENLRKLLAHLADIVKPTGRVAIISFHSLEDEIVKKTFRELAKEEKLRILTKKPIGASQEEVQNNPRSRSAKLRVAEII